MKTLVARHLSRFRTLSNTTQTEAIEKIRENDSNVVKVDLYRCELSNISFMEFNVTVTRLVISNNLIQDLSPLQFNRTLQELDVSFNLIEDLSPLRFNTTLTMLNLYGNKIRDVTPLRDLKLCVLNIGKNDVVDLLPLWGNTSLKFVNTAWNPHLPKDRERIIYKMAELNRDNSFLRRISLRRLAFRSLKNLIYSQFLASSLLCRNGD